MTVAREQYTDLLVRSGLFSADDLAEFLAALPSGAQPADGDALSTLLLERGRLTPLQHQTLAKGETKGLVYGDYIILDRIGAGGMGQVFKALHRRMKRIVAVKVLNGAHTESPNALKRFYREVEAAARLIHPNIVSAYDAGESHGTHYLVMEYVDGQDLSHHLKSRGLLPVAEAVGLIAQAARGLEHAHALGICHRDIKLSNLLIDKLGTVKVLDMGIARLNTGETGDVHLDGITQTNQLLGTVEYMAPEQGRNARLADQRSDVYSLGCCLYRLLVGRAPFAGDSAFMTVMAHMKDDIPELDAERKDVPADLADIYRKMMAKKPEDRYQSMTEVLAALAASSVAAAAGVTLTPTPAPGSVVMPSVAPSGVSAAGTGSLVVGSPVAHTGSPTPQPSATQPLVATRPAAAAQAAENGEATPRTSNTVRPGAPAVAPAATGPSMATLQALLRSWHERAQPWLAKGKVLGEKALAGVRYGCREAASTAVGLTQQARQWTVARRTEFLARHPNWDEKKFNMVLGGACALGIAFFLGGCIVLASLGGGGSQQAVAKTDTTPEVDPLAAELAALVDNRQPLTGQPRPEALEAPATAAPRPDETGGAFARASGDDVPLLAAKLALEPASLDELRRQAFAGPAAIEWSRAELSGPRPAATDELTSAVNLLQFVQLPRDAVFGEWRHADDGLDVSHPPIPVGQQASPRPLSVLVRHLPPASFDLTIVGVRRAGSGPLLVSLPVTIASSDGTRSDKLSTLSVAAGRPAPQPQGGFIRRFRPVEEQLPPGVTPTANNTPIKVVCRIRPLGIAVEVDGKPLDSWAFADVNIDRQFRHSEDKLFRLGAMQSMWRIQQMSLTPVWDAEALPAGAIDLSQVGAMQRALEPGFIPDSTRPAPPRPPDGQQPKSIRDVLRETLEGELDEGLPGVRPGKGLPVPKGLLPR